MQEIIFIGIQATGKSSFYLENFHKTHLRLSMDMLKTRNREEILFTACLHGKQPFVIDNTNPTKTDREKYITTAKKHKFSTTGYYFKSSLADSLKRNSKRTGKENIPEIGIRGTYNKLELPEYSEGFDQLYYVSIVNNCFKVEEWTNEV